VPPVSEGVDQLVDLLGGALPWLLLGLAFVLVVALIDGAGDGNGWRRRRERDDP
jgi:hypothetical protein